MKTIFSATVLSIALAGCNQAPNNGTSGAQRGGTSQGDPSQSATTEVESHHSTSSDNVVAKADSGTGVAPASPVASASGTTAGPAAAPTAAALTDAQTQLIMAAINADGTVNQTKLKIAMQGLTPSQVAALMQQLKAASGTAAPSMQSPAGTAGQTSTKGSNQQPAGNRPAPANNNGGVDAGAAFVGGLTGAVAGGLLSSLLFGGYDDCDYYEDFYGDIYYDC